MLVDRKRFLSGAALMAGFVVVLVLIFLPLFDGRNALNYLDSLYNSISKGSAYYIDDLRAQVQPQIGKQVRVALEMHDAGRASETAPLFERAGAEVTVEGSKLRVQGDLGRILEVALEDSDRMFHNDGAAVSGKYGYEERRALWNWWTALKEMDRDLSRQSRFAEAAFVLEVKKRAVECAYNYYGIEPQKITDRIFVVIFSLLFYVVYTCWYGYAIIFMFEGWGLRLSH